MAAPVDVSVSRVIRCDRARLAAFAADMGNAPKWYANIASVEWVGAPGTDPGTRAAFVANFAGRRLAYIYEILEHIPGERLVMATDEGPFPMQTIYHWEDQGKGRTRMSMTNRGRPTGFKAVVMPLMAMAMRRAMVKDLAALARLMR